MTTDHDEFGGPREAADASRRVSPDDLDRRDSSPSGPRKLLVVGGGMTAQHFLETLISRGGSVRYDISLLCEELTPPYDRVHLGTVIDGEARSLVMREPEWYAEHDIDLRLKERVVEIDRGSRIVRTEIGAEIGYDEIVLATGGSAFLPPIPGNRCPGVTTYRTLDDVERIAREARLGGRVIVAGGGLLGLEAARSIQRHGAKVIVVEMAPRLLPRQLDVDGASVLSRQIRNLGIELRTLTRLTLIQEADRGLRVELSDGETLAADMVVFAAGIRPNDGLARDAGLDCHASGGIEVDDMLTTNDPRISAIGECVRHDGELYGFVAPCYEMAEVLADRLLGGARHFDGATASARLKISEVDVAAVGESLADGTTVRDLTWLSPGHYRRVVIRDGRIVGAIAVGATPDFPRLQEAVARGSRIGARQERRFERTGSLWRERSELNVADWPDQAIVCTCTGVTCGTLRAAWESGCHSSLALSEATGAASVCGSCKPLLSDIAGESTGSLRRDSSRGLILVATASLVVIAIGSWFGPIPMSTSVLSTPTIDFLWRDGWWKQASGFSLLAVMSLGLLLPIRRRRSKPVASSFARDRLVHSAVGLLAIGLVGVHTGLRLGANLNLVLMSSFLGLVVLGALAGVVTSLEHRLPPAYGGALRIGWKRAHVALLWPIPALLLFHVLAVYVY